ncbi:MAG: MFS transporter [Ruthenibacterium sp.]
MNFKMQSKTQQPPTQAQLKKSRQVLIAEGAVASIITSLATGNFLAGYLSYLGASVSFCALVGTLPQFGCVLQLASPFLFERMQYRKTAIWILCAFFRFSLGLSIMAPVLFHGKTGQLSFVFVLYFFAFAAAGFVTPGLQQLMLDLSPYENRGSFFARKDIVAACINSVVVLLMGKQLDYFLSVGTPYTGYVIVGIVSLLLACLDAVILGAIKEQPAPFVAKVHWTDLLMPLQDKQYQPILIFLVCGGLAGGLATSFLSVYLLRGLHLSHTFITTTGVASAIIGMLGTWVWGKLADRTTWNVIVKQTAFINISCTLGWAFVTPEIAPVLAPVLLAVTAGCGGASAVAGLNLQYASSPPSGKTTYLGVTSALASMASCLSVTAGTVLQPLLEPWLGARSIPALFFVSALLCYLNLFMHAGKLPRIK